ncbi:ionotropic receptor 25a-like [Copidosoma floridanum]|uniref:ionotropic receptor 25a-like n=1 Tax=Copidosoma floridanum TaxID=29053 RepID=UPI0006C9AFB9|nr:ionotropic receptor 25a-like [Copidosoma floridanum]
MKSYRVLTVPNEPFVILDKSTRSYTGMLIDLLDKIALSLNFTYTIGTSIRDGEYGRFEEGSDKWTGLIGDLVAGKADVGLATVSVTSQRSAIVDFTDPIHPPTGLSILLQKPLPRTSLFRFFTLLDARVWLCIGALYLLTSCLLWVFDLYSPFSSRNRRAKAKEYEGRRVFGFRESLWFCMTSLTPQGSGEVPRNYSGRLVATTWWLFGFVIVTSYTANFAAFLTVSRYERTIDSWEQLQAQYKFNYTVVKNSGALAYIENRMHVEREFYEIWKSLTLSDKLTPYEKSKLAVWEYPLEDKYHKIHAAVMSHNPVEDLEEGLGRFTSKYTRFALITESTDVRFQVMTNCTFEEIDLNVAKKPFALVLRKYSPLTAKFNAVIRDLGSKGWLSELRKKWWDDNPKRKKCYDTDERTAGILIENLGGLFITLFIGVGVAYGTVLLKYLQIRWAKTMKVAPE